MEWKSLSLEAFGQSLSPFRKVPNTYLASALLESGFIFIEHVGIQNFLPL